MGILDIAKHAVTLIIEQNDNDRRVFLPRGGQLTDIHKQSAVSAKRDHGFSRGGNLRADGHRQCLADAAGRCMERRARVSPDDQPASPGRGRNCDVSDENCIFRHNFLNCIENTLP